MVANYLRGMEDGNFSRSKCRIAIAEGPSNWKWTNSVRSFHFWLEISLDPSCPAPHNPYPSPWKKFKQSVPTLMSKSWTKIKNAFKRESRLFVYIFLVCRILALNFLVWGIWSFGSAVRYGGFEIFFCWYAGFEFQKAGEKSGMRDWAPPR